MKKSTIIVIVVIVLIAIWGITSYNGMVKMDESVSTAWSNVENQYQRRSDLIPNLVNTVKKGHPAMPCETEAFRFSRNPGCPKTVRSMTIH